MKTLAELNAGLAADGFDTREWSGWTLKTEFAVIGWQKTHLGKVETVIAKPEGHKPGTTPVGGVHSSWPYCNGNGQRVGNGVRKGLDTKDITCKSCIKRLAAA